jgi:hypothetical protein
VIGLGDFGGGDRTGTTVAELAPRAGEGLGAGRAVGAGRSAMGELGDVTSTDRPADDGWATAAEAEGVGDGPPRRGEGTTAVRATDAAASAAAVAASVAASQVAAPSRLVRTPAIFVHRPRARR